MMNPKTMFLLWRCLYNYSEKLFSGKKHVDTKNIKHAFEKCRIENIFCSIHSTTVCGWWFPDEGCTEKWKDATRETNSGLHSSKNFVDACVKCIPDYIRYHFCPKGDAAIWGFGFLHASVLNAANWHRTLCENLAKHGGTVAGCR